MTGAGGGGARVTLRGVVLRRCARADVPPCTSVLFIGNSAANARGRGRQAAVDMSGRRVLEDRAEEVSRTHVSLALVLHVVFG
eukprot:COSAG01_NODE_492_length_16335_cov_63.722284_5_plen_83_part_00